MTRELVEPNFHVAVLHAPLGLLLVGTVIEFFAPVFWRRGAARAAGRWMILLGTLTLVPVAASGLYAMVHLNSAGHSDTAGDLSWADIRATSPIQGEAWQTMRDHALFNAAGSAMLLFLVVIWLASSDRIRYGLHLVFLLFLLGGVGTLAAGSWHGGEMVYRHGVGVKRTTLTSLNEPTANLAGWRTIEKFIPPVELHVMLAGGAIAAGLAALGASLRGRGGVTPPPSPYTDIGYALDAGGRVPAGYTGATQYTGAAQLHAMDAPAMSNDVQRVPTGRIWVLAILIAISAALTGWWTLASGADIWQPKDLLQLVQQKAQAKEFRLIAHVAGTASIITLMLLLGLVSRAAGRRVVIGFFGILLLAAVAAQAWVGSLLLMDTANGPVYQFNSSIAVSPSGKSPTTSIGTISITPVTKAAPATSTAPTTEPVPAEVP